MPSLFASLADTYFLFDKMAESKGNSLDLSNAEEVNKAIAMLAIRVAKLETGAPAVGRLLCCCSSVQPEETCRPLLTDFIRALLSFPHDL